MPLQSASLVLTTTPPEELALGLATLLGPLRLIGAPVKEIGARSPTSHESPTPSSTVIILIIWYHFFRRVIISAFENEFVWHSQPSCWMARS